MKKAIAFLLATMLLLAAAGCGKGDDTTGGGTPASEPAEASQPAEASEPAQSSNHVVDYKIDVPDGFEPTEMEGLTACWYNGDGSNVNLNVTEKDATTDLGFDAINADMLRMTLISTFKETYDLEPAIEDKYFTRNDVSGMPAYQYCYEMDLEGTVMNQLIVCINADQLYTVTYTDGAGTWMPDFEASAANIQLITE